MNMLNEELRQLVKQVQKDQCETNVFELKSAAQGCPKKLYDTLSSFSNQDEGGTILFGIDESNFEVCGVYDANDLQKKVNAKCKEMVPNVRAHMSVCTIEDRQVVSAEIPGVDYSQRPVYYSGKGISKGSYIRSGDSDAPMSEYEVYKYQAYKKGIHDEQRIVEDGWIIKNEDRLERYLNAVKKDRPNLFSTLQNHEILKMMKVEKNAYPTIAGLMVFSEYPQGAFPNFCVTAVAIPGPNRGDEINEMIRFTDNRRITGSIPEMLEETIDFIEKNSRRRTIIDQNGRRADEPEYPLRAVRELVLNALIHRDYSMYTENAPIRVEMFSDRLEITNSGGIYGRMPVEKLGYDSPETRNSVLTNILEKLGYSENRYSGIPVIRNEMRKRGLPAPEFINYRQEDSHLYRWEMNCEAQFFCG
ncbi:ATP-binding protein [uncultured Dubosiella sp.]|uniref:ATP-binding protein n=1 Tax=uncultured Dubosiella sp. TaxID=1937011 RepID=UPI00351A8053